MHSKARIIGTAVAVAALAVAAPAAAHEGHTDCSAGAQSYFPLASSGQLGVAASAIARDGGFAESVEAQHAALCDPK
jgi:hypothetical protein